MPYVQHVNDFPSAIDPVNIWVSLIDWGWGAARLDVEAIAEGAAGESLFVLRVGSGNVVWSRGVEPDGAVALHTANGYVRTLAGLLDADDFSLPHSFARGIGHPSSCCA